MFDVIIIGGGAAGYYTAIQIGLRRPNLKVAIFERGKSVLSKVKVSGGGRCNVTHAAFDPKELTTHYPRGEKELLGPFHSHAPGDVMEFFNERGVALKVESDGRIFPVSDSSQTIIDCFQSEVERLGVTVLKNNPVKALEPVEGGHWKVTTKNKHYVGKRVVVATGSNPKVWQMLGRLGHQIVDPVPSLFTFNIDDPRIKGLQGLSTEASVAVLPKKHYDSKIVIQLKSAVRNDPVLEADGPLLITHWGLSGPAILKLSAWGARLLHEYRYHFKIKVNWIPEYTTGSVEGFLMEVKQMDAKRTVVKTKLFDLPSRLWIALVKAADIPKDMKWADIPKPMLQALAVQLTQCVFKVTGKSTFKEEFVTAGGVDLKEVNFKTFESKLLSDLYLAGEVLNIDAITGGFNFQNAWTGAYLIAQAIAEK
ncbi:NAD(P)/FAD-dependent oxidoreductase [Flagellimonas sp. DF-77]|uniref:NAD(P)/FAD-dependent oxidoreductase n=1 Tax=Flagellimonas algarum TaxID=3230298 RepID=UPI0033922D99